MGVTSIQWCDHSINPVRARYAATKGDGHYCEKVSPGCAHCYSSRMQPRFGMPVFDVQRRGGVESYLDESKLQEVLSRKKPTRYFWCDMSDLFGAWVPDEWIDRCFATMALTPQHTHLMLTKRAERMQAYCSSVLPVSGNGGRDLPYLGNRDRLAPVCFPLSNMWLGVSVEDQKRADERIPLLLQTPAAVRFISAEPLLGPVDLLHIPREGTHHDYLTGEYQNGDREKRTTPSLDWVIVGGESGPGARPMDLAWARSLVEQCKAAGVACFYKQGGASHRCRHDSKGGCFECVPVDLRVREFPVAP